jgi:hypothetical protein
LWCSCTECRNLPTTSLERLLRHGSFWRVGCLTKGDAFPPVLTLPLQTYPKGKLSGKAEGAFAHQSRRQLGYLARYDLLWNSLEPSLILASIIIDDTYIWLWYIGITTTCNY